MDELEDVLRAEDQGSPAGIEVPPVEADANALPDVPDEEPVGRRRRSRKADIPEETDGRKGPPAEDEVGVAGEDKPVKSAKPRKRKRFGNVRKKRRRTIPEDEGVGDEPIRIRILKSKKGRSLIQHSKRIQLNRGERFYLNSTPGSAAATAEKVEEVSGEEVGTKAPAETESMEESRGKFIAGSLNLGLFNQTTDGSTTEIKLRNFELNVAYGWNFARFELALFAEYNFTTVDTFDASTLLGGVFLDLNFMKNELSEQFLLGLRVTAGAGIQDNSSRSSAGTAVRVQPALFFKWFGLSADFAFLTQVGYRIEFVTTGGAKTTSKGIAAQIGIQTYF